MFRKEIIVKNSISAIPLKIGICSNMTKGRSNVWNYFCLVKKRNKQLIFFISVYGIFFSDFHVRRDKSFKMKIQNTIMHALARHRPNINK